MALRFGGTGTDVVDLGEDFTHNLDPFTFMAWAFPTDSISNRRLFSILNDRSSLFQDGSARKLRFNRQRATTNTQYTTNTEALVENAWNFIACTFNSANGAGEIVNIYTGLLGVVATEKTYAATADGAGALSDDTHPFRIGNRFSNNNQFPGDIAVVTYLSGELTLEEIISWQFQPRALPGAEFFMHLGFNGTGQQPDLSGHGLNGTVINAVVADHVPLGPPFGFDFEWTGAFTEGGAPAPGIEIFRRRIEQD